MVAVDASWLPSYFGVETSYLWESLSEHCLLNPMSMHQVLIFLGCRMVVAIFISLAARLLNSIDGHLLCYSAISSAGVVLILPGFLVCMFFLSIGA